MKTYRAHRCSRRHRSWRTFANCVWPWQVWPSAIGDGPFASVSRCNMRPGIPRYRYGVSVILFATAEAALAAKAGIDRTGCGGMCQGDHEVVQLMLEDAGDGAA